MRIVILAQRAQVQKGINNSGIPPSIFLFLILLVLSWQSSLMQDQLIR